MLEHGGNLFDVARRFNRSAEQWLDLSTGISPYSYPSPEIPDAVWRELPQFDEALVNIARAYYRSPNLLPCAGSQSVIQILPDYRRNLGFSCGRVWLPKQGYKEHEKAWRDTGFEIKHYTRLPEKVELGTEDILVVINPNNPTGERYSRARLSELMRDLKRKRGWLVVDEAFMDAVENPNSMAGYCELDNLFVLRSVGKFFGLAGVRLGFVFSGSTHVNAINALMGPWCVNGPAQYIAKIALADRDWQKRHTERLKTLSDALTSVLQQHFNTQVVGTFLFKTLYLENAEAIFDGLCRHAVYVRLTDERDALRFGIPTPEQRLYLDSVLNNIV